MGGEVQFLCVGPASCFQLIRHEVGYWQNIGRPATGILARLRDSEGVDPRRGGNPECHEYWKVGVSRILEGRERKRLA